MTLCETIEDIRSRQTLPDLERYESLLETGIFFLEQESPGIRPSDSTGRSGGLVHLKKGIPTVIIPDLHGRKNFFARALNANLLPQGSVLLQRSVLDCLKENSIQVLCLGDGFHTEYKTRQRWLEAFEEYRGGFKKHDAMDDEMKDSLSLMEMVLACKTTYPENFHFLKGNHENILNEEGNGNHAFMKAAYEGEMVRSWTEKFYGDAFLNRFAHFEKCLPLFATGDRFLASHAEPAMAYDAESIIDARANPEITLGLTWTANGAAEEGSVESILEAFLPGDSEAVYLGGHRPVEGRFAYRANKRFIQIHNPEKEILALAIPGKAFDPETDILELE